MDDNFNVYKAENPPAEDVARLDGYLRGVADGMTDEERAAAIEALRYERNDAKQEAATAMRALEAERLARDVADRLRIEAQVRLREYEGGER